MTDREQMINAVLLNAYKRIEELEDAIRAALVLLLHPDGPNVDAAVEHLRREVVKAADE